MDKQNYVPFILAIFLMAMSIYLIYSADKDPQIINENPTGFVWPTYQHDFERTGNLQLKNYEIKDEYQLESMGSNAPESMDQDIFGDGNALSTVFADVDFDGDDETISFFKNMVRNKTTHTRPFAGFVMLVDPKKNPTTLEALEFGDVPFIRKWYFVVDGDVHTSFAVGDIDLDNSYEVVFGTDNGNLYALDAKDGKLEWQFKIKEKIRSSPVIGDIDSDGVQEVIFGSDNGNLYALDGITGKQEWIFKTQGMIRGSPTLFMEKTPHIAFGNDDRNLYVIDGRGKKVCSFEADGIIRSSPLIYDGNIVFSDVDGNIYFLSKKCVLQKRHKIQGKIFGSGALFEDKVMFSSDNGFLYLFDETEKKSKINISAPAHTTPVNVNDSFILISTIDGNVKLINETGVYGIKGYYKNLSFFSTPSVGVSKGILYYAGFYIQAENITEYACIFISPSLFPPGPLFFQYD